MDETLETWVHREKTIVGLKLEVIYHNFGTNQKFSAYIMEPF